MAQNHAVVFKSQDYKTLPKSEVPCACCGSNEHVLAVQGDRFDFGLTTVVCKTCGLIFTSPRPNQAWFDEFYSVHYRHFYSGLDIPDAEFLNLKWNKERHTHNLALIKPFLKPQGRVLDIGCGEGAFLHLFQQEFPEWECYGIEPNIGFAEYARTYFGLTNVITGFFTDRAIWPQGKVDLIIANHVLEHLLDPNEFFLMARELLTPGGMLFIDVPNAAQTVVRTPNVVHIAHVYHYSPHSMRNFLAKHGFADQVMQPGSPFTFNLNVVAFKQEMPQDWQPVPADSQAIAQAFARTCYYPLQKRIYRKLIAAGRYVPEFIKRWFRPLIKRMRILPSATTHPTQREP